MDSASIKGSILPRDAADTHFPHNMDAVIACKCLVQFCELTKGLSFPTSPLIPTRAPLSWKSFLGDPGPGRLFWTFPLRSDSWGGGESFFPLQPHRPLAKDSCPYLSLRTVSIQLQPLEAGEDSTAPGRMGKPTLPRWSVGTPVPAQNHLFSRLFPGSTQISSTLP